MTRTLDDFTNVQTVKATRNIQDVPLAGTDAGAKRGDVGIVDDILYADDLLVVDFGRGAILCEVSELIPFIPPFV